MSRTFDRLVEELRAKEQSNQNLSSVDLSPVDLPPVDLPPVEKWNPPLSGRIDIRIARDGTWYHEGTAFGRQSLVKLFSSILKREGDDYFLVTPVEKWQIEVEDAPLLVTRCEIVEHEGNQALLFTTATDDVVLLGSDNPIRVEANPETGEPSPYLLVRNNLEARINRPVYYQLVGVAREKMVAGQLQYVISSMGVDFPIG